VVEDKDEQTLDFEVKSVDKAKLMMRPNNGKKSPVEYTRSAMLCNFVRFCLSLRMYVCLSVRQ